MKMGEMLSRFNFVIYLNVYFFYKMSLILSLLEPGRGPENVSAKEVNYTTFQLTWEAIPKEVANGIIRNYQVRLVLKENCTLTQSASAFNTTTTIAVLTGISMCAKYEVSVRGYTAVGPGPYSRPVVLQTLGE